MPSIFKKPQHTASLGRNGFDMSQTRKFTSSCGQLLPVYYDYLNPGDKVKANSRIFTRTEAVQTAAMVDIAEHVEWFFVPFQQLYRFFGDFFYGINDVDTALINASNVVTTVPAFDFYNLFYNLKSDTKFFGKNGSTYYYTTDEFNVSTYWNLIRLCDLLGYSSHDIHSSVEHIHDYRLSDVNLFLLLAYQKIFMDYYRITQYTSNVASAYNIDNYYNSGTIETIKSEWFKLRYRPWRKDFFTNIMPSPLFYSNNASALGGSTSSFVSNIPNYEGGKNSTFGQSDSYQSSIYNILPSDRSLNLNVIRSMYAVDKLMRITNFAGAHYDKQTAAHFGYKVPQGVSNEVYYLGKQTVQLNINEVVSTASTGAEGAGAVLGDIAGKGFASGTGSPIEFTAPCHGILMAIFSIEPTCDYHGFSRDRINNYISRYDFYVPELDNLGMQPLYAYQYLGGATPNPLLVAGWQYRHTELKCKYDVVNGAFNYPGKSDWVAVREFSSTPSTALYISPSYTDQIFLYGFSRNEQSYSMPTLNSLQKIYDGDNFLNFISFNVYKTSCMSVYGLPQL